MSDTGLYAACDAPDCDARATWHVRCIDVLPGFPPDLHVCDDHRATVLGSLDAWEVAHTVTTW